jgi:hypothetical protein
MVAIDAPQLENCKVDISNDGRVCQITLRNRADEALRFVLSYRQCGYLVNPLRAAAGEMRRRLLANKAAAEAEMMEAFKDTHLVAGVSITRAADSGDPLLFIETAEGGAMSLRLPKDMVSKVSANLASVLNQGAATPPSVRH